MSRLLRSAGALGALLMVTGMAGCASSWALAPSPSFPARPAADSFPSCGDITLGQGESIPQAAVDCMSSAGLEGAMLTVTAPTTEGDPIVTVYTVEPDGSMTVYMDMTQDHFGGGISVQICPEAVSVLDLGACEDPTTK